MPPKGETVKVELEFVQLKENVRGVLHNQYINIKDPKHRGFKMYLNKQKGRVDVHRTSPSPTTFRVPLSSVAWYKECGD